MFIFKKKPIHVDCFVDNYGVANIYPVAEAVHYIPMWWKNMAKTFTDRSDSGVKIETGTIKICSGFIDLYKTGLIIPMWSDVALKTKADGTWAAAFPDTSLNFCIVTHRAEQYGNDVFNPYIHMKFVSPWVFKEKTGVKFLFHGCSWNIIPMFQGIHVVPGMVEYKYQVNTNVNVFVEKRDRQLNIPAGMPFAHCVPLSDRPVKVHVQLTDKNEINKLRHENIAGVSTFLYRHKIMKKFNEKKAKCPFYSE